MGLLFECPVHKDQWEKLLKKSLFKIKCEDCRRIVKAARHNKEVAARSPRPAKLRMSVYWPSNEGFQGRVVQNLTPSPTYVRNKDEYRDLLKRTGSQEAG